MNTYVQLRPDLIYKAEDYKKLLCSFTTLTKCKTSPEINLRHKHQEAFLALFEEYVIDLHEPKDFSQYMNASSKMSLNLRMLEGKYLQSK